ncbi:uncharacterized protein E0L32_004164 [Thyridium curvatum]|uniref:Zn(2)-C6 fungal-type domain-containing protein n=1 Tax=Thyridium curvatum TaxID=1093900 RepID=A0A507BFU4_9PEZI|nr:uncharacterized protein E0L32_004164 [Thyridium curvatum]TPX16169.1 hypothetical protein E0L32_004164 [Thyridium curvatum]
MSALNSNLELSEPRDPLRYRKKRRQVARACEQCRRYRIKCDDDAPCLNCRTNDRQCSRLADSLSSEEEIARLKQKVRSLEEELQQERSRRIAVEQQQQPTPTLESPASSPASSQNENSNHGYSQKRFWDGVHIRPPRSPHSSWFGPSSLYYYIFRLNTYLNSALQQYQLATDILPVSVSSGDIVENPVRKPSSTALSLATGSVDASEGVYLKPVQEEYFLSLFWESYHTSLFAVLDEAQFKQHYQSLFASSTTSRDPSALVDIVVAMCMQNGLSSLPCDRQGSIVEDKDPTVAGRWHYRRGQLLLASESESPTIATLQAHLLRATFLCGGSFHNMVDSACASAVRTAYMLGLHQNTPLSMPEAEQQLRRRLWWAVCVLDSKIGMKLGRPFSVPVESHIMPELPRDDAAAARMSGSMFAPIGHDATWLSFNLQNTKLYMVVRDAYSAFYDRDLRLGGGQAIWDHPQIMEDLADNLFNYAELLFKEWTDNVPRALTIPRQPASRPFSTGGSTLILEQYAPLWLQRQRVLLELTYHHLCTNLFRPFLYFGQTPHPAESCAEAGAMKCCSHAMEVVHITHQVLESTDILNGWHEAFQWTWGAALTLVGFALLYPGDPRAAQARAAIDQALAVFDTFGASFATAASAATIMRSHCAKVDYLVSKWWFERSNIGSASGGSEEVAVAMNSVWPTLSLEMPLDDAFQTSGLSGIGGLDTLGTDGSLLDATLGVDFWADLDMLWPELGNVS